MINFMGNFCVGGQSQKFHWEISSVGGQLQKLTLWAIGLVSEKIFPKTFILSQGGKL